MTDPLRDHEGGCELDVLVVPRASRDQIVGVHDGRLKVQLTAPPVEGAANAALCEWLAGRLGLPKSALTVARGATGRRKTVRVAGLGAAVARARLGLAAVLLFVGACTAELPFPVRVILPEEPGDLRRADNVALELAPQGFVANYEVEGTDFELEIEIEPDDVPRTLSLYLADGKELLAYGHSAPFVLLDPPGDLAVLLARPGVLSIFPGTVPEPDPDLLAARAPGRGLMLLGSAGDVALLNEYTYQAEGGARLDPEGGLPAPSDGAFVPDATGKLWRLAWAEGVRAFVYDPSLDTWTTVEVAGDTGPRPGAAWAADASREHVWIAGGDPADLRTLSLVPDAEGHVVLSAGPPLDGPRPGATLVPIARGDGETLLVFGGDAALPAAFFPDVGHGVGPAGAWTGAQCAVLEGDADAPVVRVLCLGGLRGGQPSADAVVLDCPEDAAETTVEELPGFFAAPLADPRLFADDLAVYAQQGSSWHRVDRSDLTLTTTDAPATRESGGHSLALGTGVTFLVGGRDADARAVASWWFFAPTLPPS